MRGEKQGRIGALCGCCKMCSHSCGLCGTWTMLFVFLVLAAATAVLLILREKVLVLLPEAHFTSHTAFNWAFGLGVVLAAMAVYGLVALMPFCNFEGVNHRKLFAVLAAAVALVFVLTAAMTAAWAVDEVGMRFQLEFGWHEAYHGRPTAGKTQAAGKALIRAAQTDLACCGFGRLEKDRPVQPCPRGAQFGCEAPLLEEMRLSLLVLAGMEAGGAFLLASLVGLVACNAEAEKDALSRGEAPSGGTIGGRAADVTRPSNPTDVIYPPVLGHFVPGGGPSGPLPGAGVGWDEHAVVGGMRGARSVSSRGSSHGVGGTVVHRASAGLA